LARAAFRKTVSQLPKLKKVDREKMKRVVATEGV